MIASVTAVTGRCPFFPWIGFFVILNLSWISTTTRPLLPHAPFPLHAAQTLADLHDRWLEESVLEPPQLRRHAAAGGVRAGAAIVGIKV